MPEATIAPAKTSLIRLDQIDIPSDARSHDPAALDILAHDMGEEGQLQEIIVEAKGGRYSVIAGVGRTLAARKLGWKELRASVREGVSEFDRARITFSENEDRENVDPYYQAGLIIKMLRSNGDTQESLAKELGVSPATISIYVDIAGLPKQFPERFRRLNLGQITQIVRLNNADSKIAFAEKCVKNDLSVRQLKVLVDRALQKPSVSRKSRSTLANLPDPMAHIWENIHSKKNMPAGVYWEQKYGTHQSSAGKMNGWSFYVFPQSGAPQQALAQWFTSMGKALSGDLETAQDRLRGMAREVKKAGNKVAEAAKPRLPSNKEEEKELEGIAMRGTPLDVYQWIYGADSPMLAMVPATWQQAGDTPEEGLKKILEGIREFQKTGN